MRTIEGRENGDRHYFPESPTIRAFGKVVPVPILPSSGIYLLLLDVPSSVAVRVGALGEVRLVAGRYGYVGSARRGLGARLARHRRREKPLRWHLDYLRSVAEPVGALIWRWRRGRECRLARAVRRTGLGEIAAPRFGASDCGCAGHLLVLTGVEMGIIARDLAAALGEEAAAIVQFPHP